MILEVKGVTKQFGGLTAVSDVSFELPESTIWGLIGPNGAGKTTLFNCINGVYPPSKGAVAFKGQTITGLPTYRIADLGLARTHQKPHCADHRLHVARVHYVDTIGDGHGQNHRPSLLPCTGRFRPAAAMPGITPALERPK